VRATPNALETIRRIENQVDETIRDATKKAELTKKKAVQEGEAAKKKLIDDAHNKISEYGKKKEEESKTESTSILNQGKKQSSGLRDELSSRLASAADAVTKMVIGD
jgi:vacuolar-type H+-ATPase subunit H